MNQKPNILLILCDSLPPQFTGPYGSAVGATPNLDALAARGVVFEQTYCNAPLCAPSRASLVTGRYGSELGCFDNASAFSSEWPTLGHALGAVGYESAIIGKMHFVGHDQHHGFGQRLALETDYSKGYNPRLYQLAYDWDQPSAGNPNSPHMMGESYVASERWRDYRLHFDRDETIHREALQYLAAAKDGPFLAVVSYHAPHNPFWAPEEALARFRGRELPLPAMPEDADHGPMDAWLNDFHYVPEIRARLMTRENLQWLHETFYAMLYDLDRRVGELLSALEQHAHGDTVVVFTSDHGDMMGERGMVQKRYFYEPSVRVPLIVALPGRFAPGRRQELTTLLDLFPTLAALAGAPTPAGLPGADLLPALNGDTPSAERTIFAEYHGEGVHAPCFMVRRGDAKYLYVHGFEERLYDLRADPAETTNVANDPGRDPVRRALRAALFEQFEPAAVARAARTSQRNRRFIYDCLR